MTADHVRGLPKTIETVIADLAPHMTTLVEAFALPPEYLATIPLAGGTPLAQYADDRAPLVAT